MVPISLLRERQTTCYYGHDSDTCYRETADRNIQGCGHKLYMDNYFSSPDLYRDLTKQKINCCGTVRPNCKGMPDDFRSKTLKLKRGDFRVRTSGDMTALVWKDKLDVYIMTKHSRSTSKR
jgi:hypothetical protein